MVPAPLIQAGRDGAEAVSPQSPFHLVLRRGASGSLVKTCATWGLVTGQSPWAASVMELVLGPRLVVEEHDLHLPWPQHLILGRAPIACGHSVREQALIPACWWQWPKAESF